MITASYSPKIQAAKLTKEVSGACKIEWIRVTGEDPVDKKPRSIRIRSYSGAGSSRAVVILPPITGTTPLERGYAGAFCNENIQAVIIDTIQRDTPVGLSIKSYDQVALRKLAAIRHVIELLNAKHTKSIGILGTSAGALIASLALSVEPRIKSGVLIAAGGDLAQIAVDSTEASQTKLREQRMRAFGYHTRAEYLRALKSQIVINNLDFVGFTGPKPTWMSIIVDDTVVPTRTQLALRNALRPTIAVEYTGDHLAGIIKTFLFEEDPLPILGKLQRKRMRQPQRSL